VKKESHPDGKLAIIGGSKGLKIGDESGDPIKLVRGDYEENGRKKSSRKFGLLP